MRFYFKYKRGVGYLAIGLAVLSLTFLAAKFTVLPASLRTHANLEAASIGQNLSPFKSYARGRVVAIVDEQTQEIPGVASAGQKWQLLSVTIETGQDASTNKQVEYLTQGGKTAKSLAVGDLVVLGYIERGVEQAGYVVVDRYRIPGLALFGIGFLLILFWVARWRGLLALAGLLFSLAVLLLFVGPSLVLGRNASLVIFSGLGLIALVSGIVAHGLNRRACIGALSNLLTVTAAFGLSHLAIWGLHMFGGGSDEVYYLNSALMGTLDTRGILLATILAGTLGALDDITATQTAAVDVLYKTGEGTTKKFKDIFNAAMLIGREHVAALVNTLALVYASVALPFILLLLITFDQPLWVILNSETIAEELVRALVGGAVLILAVPITTALAAWMLKLRLMDHGLGA